MEMLNHETEQQVNACLHLLKEVLGNKLLGVYLYGSAILGGLQKYSDIDLFVIIDRPTTAEEKVKLVASLLQISGIYMKSSNLPIEMLIVVKSALNPWQYPPTFDFQYGDWLREKFESGIVEPWSTKEMPDIAILVTQVLLASKSLLGPDPNQLLPKVPYHDFIKAATQATKDLMSDIYSDTRNVLLTYARIWSTVETDTLHSKPAAADWVIDRLPDKYRSVMKRAKAICIGEETEYWDDMQSLIKPCAELMANEINKRVSILKLADNNKTIKLRCN